MSGNQTVGWVVSGAAIVVGIGVGMVLVSLVLSGGSTPDRTAVDAGSIDVQRVNIVAPDGTVRATLGLADDGRVALDLLDPDGAVRAAMTLTADHEVGLVLTDRGVGRSPIGGAFGLDRGQWYPTIEVERNNTASIGLMDPSAFAPGVLPRTK